MTNTVTRKKLRTALSCLRRGSEGMSWPAIETISGEIAANLGLEIVEDAPEGRECDCGAVGRGFACKRFAGFQPYRRCTITEGETENARLREALEFAESALIHAAENMPHPDQMIDDAKDKARDALKETNHG